MGGSHYWGLKILSLCCLVSGLCVQGFGDIGGPFLDLDVCLRPAHWFGCLFVWGQRLILNALSPARMPDTCLRPPHRGKLCPFRTPLSSVVLAWSGLWRTVVISHKRFDNCPKSPAVKHKRSSTTQQQDFPAPKTIYMLVVNAFVYKINCSWFNSSQGQDFFFY